MDPHTKKIISTYSVRNSYFATLLLATDWLAIFLIAYEHLILGALPSLVTIILVGVFQYRLQILGHDTFHNSLFESSRLNRLVGRWLIVGPTFGPYELNRKNHINHHNFFTTERDKDWHYYRFTDKSTKLKFLIWTLSQFLFSPLLIAKKLLTGVDKPKANGKKTETNVKGLLLDLAAVTIAQVVILCLISLTQISFLATLQKYLILWFFPAYFVFIPLNSIRSFAEHVIASKDEIKENRLFSFPANIQNFFLAPHNMNFHSEHHQWMSVPCYNLHAFSKVIAKSTSISYRPSYFAFILSFWKHLKLI